jgi:putative PIN family toxin of toxin-antitoxin system
MIVVFDNNVLISAALLKQSIPFKAFEKAIKNHEILRSSIILHELENVILRSKFDKYFKDSLSKETFILLFIASSINIEVSHAVNICRDPKDNMYLDVALSGNANAIITGDADLLILNPFCNIPIITPKYFIDNY